MKIKAFLITLALFMFIVLPAFAVQWYKISKKRYVDLNSVRVDIIKGKKYITVWIKNLNNGDLKSISNKKVWYMMNQETYDCSDRTIKLKYAVQYGLKNESLGGSNLYGQPEPVIPQSVGEATLMTLCNMY